MWSELRNEKNKELWEAEYEIELLGYIVRAKDGIIECDNEDLANEILANGLLEIPVIVFPPNSPEVKCCPFPSDPKRYLAMLISPAPDRAKIIKAPAQAWELFDKRGWVENPEALAWRPRAGAELFKGKEGE